MVNLEVATPGVPGSAGGAAAKVAVEDKSTHQFGIGPQGVSVDAAPATEAPCSVQTSTTVQGRFEAPRAGPRRRTQALRRMRAISIRFVSIGAWGITATPALGALAYRDHGGRRCRSAIASQKALCCTAPGRSVGYASTRTTSNRKDGMATIVPGPVMIASQK